MPASTYLRGAWVFQQKGFIFLLIFVGSVGLIFWIWGLYHLLSYEGYF
jgi:hypothetical protein